MDRVPSFFLKLRLQLFGFGFLLNSQFSLHLIVRCIHIYSISIIPQIQIGFIYWAQYLDEVLVVQSLSFVDFDQSKSMDEFNAYGAIDGILNECTSLFYRELNNRGYTSYDYNLKYGYISWIATNDKDRGKGIAGNLINTCSLALKNTENCSLITAYCVSPKATRVFQNQGFTIWGQIPYHSYKYKNRIPFHILPDEISIVVKDLTLPL